MDPTSGEGSAGVMGRQREATVHLPDAIARERATSAQMQDNKSEANDDLGKGNIGDRAFLAGKIEKEMERRPENWLKLLMEAVSEFVILKDKQGRWVQASDRALELFHLSACDYCGKTNQQLAQDNPLYREPLLADAASDETTRWARTTTHLCLALVNSQGSQTALEMKKVPLWDAEGSLEGIAVVGRESAFRVEKEQPPSEPETRASILLNSAPLMLWTANANGQIDFFNQNWLEFTGHTPEEALNGGWVESLHPEDRPQCLESLRLALQSRQKYEQEYRLRSADGDYRWILDVGVPRYGSEGEFLGYAGSCVDITHRKDIESACRASEAKNRALLNAIPDLMLRLRDDGMILEFKEAPENAMPIVPVEVGRWLHEVWPVEIAARGMEYVRASLETREMQTWEYQLEIEGKWRDREARIVACAENEVVVILRDITDRKQAEEALVRVTQAVDSASDAIAIADAKGQHIYQNQAFSELFEYPTVEALNAAGGLRALYVDPQVGERIFERVAHGHSWISTVTQRTRRGDILEVFLRADAIKDATGKIIGTIAISTASPARVQVEAALQQSKQKLSLHLQQTPLAVVECNLTGEIVEWNPAAEAMFGYRKSEIIGRSRSVLFPENASENGELRWTELLSQNGGTCSICENLTKAGNRIVCEWYNTPLVDREGRAIGVASLAQDITERVRAEEALRLQSQQQRLVNATQARIRQSLNLDEILNTAVSEVRQLIDCDRVVIYRIWPDGTGSVVTESVVPGWPTMLGQSFGEEIFPASCYERYCEGEVRAIADLEGENSPQCLIEFLQPYGVKAKTIAPLLHEDRLWGLLVAHQCRGTRQWQPFEIEVFDRLSTQLAIAIQQSTLFKQLEAANEELQRLASLDGLTHVANRRCFDTYLEREWRRMIREQSVLALILCDLDYFKFYNDTYGHQAGDTCLKNVAEAIANTVKRPADLVARYGGEEFAVILPNTPAEGAMQVAQEIRNNVKALQIPHSASPLDCVSLSLGVAATLPRPKQSVKDLIVSADRALYEAKSQGRDRAVLKKCRFL